MWESITSWSRIPDVVKRHFNNMKKVCHKGNFLSNLLQCGIKRALHKHNHFSVGSARELKMGIFEELTLLRMTEGRANSFGGLLKYSRPIWTFYHLILTTNINNSICCFSHCQCCPQIHWDAEVCRTAVLCNTFFLLYCTVIPLDS